MRIPFSLFRNKVPFRVNGIKSTLCTNNIPLQNSTLCQSFVNSRNFCSDIRSFSQVYFYCNNSCLVMRPVFPTFTRKGGNVYVTKFGKFAFDLVPLNEFTSAEWSKKISVALSPQECGEWLYKISKKENMELTRPVGIVKHLSIFPNDDESYTFSLTVGEQIVTAEISKGRLEVIKYLIRFIIPYITGFGTLSDKQIETSFSSFEEKLQIIPNEEPYDYFSSFQEK